MHQTISPVGVFICAFGVAAFAGLATHLREGKPVNTVSVLTAMLNSGILGLAFALLWYTKYQDNIYFLIGMCLLAGLGGAAMIDFVIQRVKNGGISLGGLTVKLGTPGKEKDDDEPKQ